MGKETGKGRAVTPGLRLAWARQLVEPNRSEFARKMGVDVSTIRKIEEGSRQPSAGLLHRICHFLRITEAYYYDGNLSGCDPQLVAMLVVQHHELRPRDNPGKGSPASTHAVPMALAVLIDAIRT